MAKEEEKERGNEGREVDFEAEGGRRRSSRGRGQRDVRGGKEGCKSSHGEERE